MGSNWNYQVMRYQLWDEDDDGQSLCGYGIHEYYKLATGDTWTEEPVPVVAESPEELKAILEDMLRDLETHGVKDYDAGENE